MLDGVKLIVRPERRRPRYRSHRRPPPPPRGGGGPLQGVGGNTAHFARNEVSPQAKGSAQSSLIPHSKDIPCCTCSQPSWSLGRSRRGSAPTAGTGSTGLPTTSGSAAAPPTTTLETPIVANGQAGGASRATADGQRQQPGDAVTMSRVRRQQLQHPGVVDVTARQRPAHDAGQVVV